MYVVVEFMIDASGNPGSFVYTYSDLAQAKAKYHTILAAAALSNTRVHSAAILTEELYMVQSESCQHEV